MARRKKQHSLSTLQIIILAISSIVLLFIYKYQINTPNLGLFIIGLIIILFIFASVFLFLENKHRKAKLKAIDLSGVDQMTGIEFEKYIGQILKSQYYKISFTSTSHDYGVDIIANKDKNKIAVQLKRYSNTVGRSAISDAVAGMAHYKCSQTMVITNNYFTREARELALSNNCHLIDRGKLSEWIYSFQVK